MKQCVQYWAFYIGPMNGTARKPVLCLCSVSWESVKCHLFWEGDQLLYIGWADSVKVWPCLTQ